jgi:hypothetical protein
VPQLCLHFLTGFCGVNPTGNIEPSLIPTIFQHLPAGTSVQVMSHWAQVSDKNTSAPSCLLNPARSCVTSFDVPEYMAVWCVCV